VKETTDGQFTDQFSTPLLALENDEIKIAVDQAKTVPEVYYLEATTRGGSVMRKGMSIHTECQYFVKPETLTLAVP
jgi:hypothetical protein